jgi:hypothetical protein
MPEKEVLDFKPAPRPEQVGDKRPKQQKECSIAQDEVAPRSTSSRATISGLDE